MRPRNSILTLLVLALATVAPPVQALDPADAAIPVAFHGLPDADSVSLAWLPGLPVPGTVLSEYRLYRHFVGNGTTSDTVVNISPSVLAYVDASVGATGVYAYALTAVYVGVDGQLHESAAAVGAVFLRAHVPNILSTYPYCPVIRDDLTIHPDCLFPPN